MKNVHTKYQWPFNFGLFACIRACVFMSCGLVWLIQSNIFALHTLVQRRSEKRWSNIKKTLLFLLLFFCIQFFSCLFVLLSKQYSNMEQQQSRLNDRRCYFIRTLARKREIEKRYCRKKTLSSSTGRKEHPFLLNSLVYPSRKWANKQLCPLYCIWYDNNSHTIDVNFVKEKNLFLNGLFWPESDNSMN